MADTDVPHCRWRLVKIIWKFVEQVKYQFDPQGNRKSSKYRASPDFIVAGYREERQDFYLLYCTCRVRYRHTYCAVVMLYTMIHT